MEDRAPPSLQPLTSYIKHQWMENPVFPVRSWSVYQFVVRTNNDVEGICIIFIVEFFCGFFLLHLNLTYHMYSSFTGWHHRMNSKARVLPLPFYQLIPVLFREAEIVQSRIAATDLERDVRRTSHLVQQKISTASEWYMNKEISSSAFLKICGSIYAAPFQWLWLTNWYMMCDNQILVLLFFWYALVYIVKYQSYNYTKIKDMNFNWYWLYLFFSRLLRHKN